MTASVHHLPSRRSAYADATERTYARLWQSFEIWCQGRGRSPLPAHPDSVALYVESLDIYTPATVSSHMSAIAQKHKSRSLPSPTREPEVRAAMKAHARTHGRAQAQATGLTADAVDAILAVVDSPRLGRGGLFETEEQAASRAAVDRALVLTMRDSMLRRAEAAALTWEDIEDLPGKPGGCLTVNRSKTDQEGLGAVTYLAPATMAALEALRERRGEAETIFGLSPSQIARRIARMASEAGLAGCFSGHSPRIGMAQDLVADGAELPAVMEAGRWKAPNMVATYTRKQALHRGAVAQWHQKRNAE